MKAPEYILSRPWAMLPDRVEQMIAIAERMNDVEAVLAKVGKPLDNTQGVRIRGSVAVVPVIGVISRYADLFTYICGGTTVEHLSRDIQTAIDDPNIESIILEIDSPGGQAAGIGELAALIHAGSQIKPIVSYVSNLGASAGYWIASAGSEIVASPSAILGSVGVVWPMSRTTDDGKTIEFVSSQSPNKRLSTETKEGRAEYQAMVDGMADVFIGAVANYRETTPAKVVSDFGAGGLKIGQAAVDAGMADRLGSLEALITELSNGGPAGSSLPIKHGGAAVAGSKDHVMKFNFKGLIPKWIAAGAPDTMDVDETEAVVGVQPKTEDFATSLAKFQASQLMVPAGPTARELELQAQLDAFKATQDTALTAEAGTWFDLQVKNGKTVPADREAYLAAYVEYSKADAVTAIASFSRLGSFKASIEGRKPNGLTTESIPTDAEEATEFFKAGGFKRLPAAAVTPNETQAAKDKEIVAEMLAAINEGE
ncbi:S49 family peptidase [Singulisphaera sp. Ch08]|uniref:S49 family peptidase n=1 Tax=Singulisphaera sp. Ch08 TaxID=3120278 RepID=A0AAU7CJU2_9BACT